MSIWLFLQKKKLFPTRIPNFFILQDWLQQTRGCQLPSEPNFQGQNPYNKRLFHKNLGPSHSLRKKILSNLIPAVTSSHNGPCLKRLLSPLIASDIFTPERASGKSLKSIFTHAPWMIIFPSFMLFFVIRDENALDGMRFKESLMSAFWIYVECECSRVDETE